MSITNSYYEYKDIAHSDTKYISLLNSINITATMEQKNDPNKLNELKEIKYNKACHRGIVSKYQENTEDGIKEAIRQKFDIIDLDVMITQNGDMVCSHDKNVKDFVVGHQDTMIQSMTKDQIKNLVIDKEIIYSDSVMKYDTTNKFCFLEDVFDKYIDDIVIWIDIKGTEILQPYYCLPFLKCFSCCDDQSAEILNNFLKTRKDKLHRVIVSSSNHLFVRKFIKLVQKDGYRDKINICFDFGDNTYNKILVDIDAIEEIYKPQYIAIERTLATQMRIDEFVNKGIKMIIYSYSPDGKLDFENVDTYLFDM